MSEPADTSLDSADPPVTTVSDLVDTGDEESSATAALLHQIAHISIGDTEETASVNMPDPLIGRRLGTWLLRARLGSGGWGVVYQAEHQVLPGRIVAIKLLRQRHSHSDQHRLLLEREARNAYQVQHPNVAQVHDMSEIEGTSFVVMEFVEGSSLSSLIAQSSLSVLQVLDYARQIAEGLAAAHQVGVIHRDLSANNVMVNTTGQVKILDFGISKAACEKMPPPHSRGRWTRCATR